MGPDGCVVCTLNAEYHVLKSNQPLRIERSDTVVRPGVDRHTANPGSISEFLPGTRRQSRPQGPLRALRHAAAERQQRDSGGEDRHVLGLSR